MSVLKMYQSKYFWNLSNMENVLELVPEVPKEIWHEVSKYLSLSNIQVNYEEKITKLFSISDITLKELHEEYEIPSSTLLDIVSGENGELISINNVPASIIGQTIDISLLEIPFP